MRSCLFFALIGCLGILVGCGPADRAGRRQGPVPKPGEPWRGGHVLCGNGEALELLYGEIPRLAALGVNVVVAEVDYGLAYACHPELHGPKAVTREQARKLAARCREHRIRLIPQFQCLGHQSWKRNTGPLLTKYPELDETPGQFPNNEGIYCRSWCPLHPKVNGIIFELFDELLEAFEADALHVGMDEVFLIGSEHCPRCRGKDPAELFAKAVKDYHGHLVGKRGVEMLMWGDRLLDARATGYGKWSASDNGTAGAIDMIPTDIIICDWHYDKRAAYPSIPLFQEKGFRVWPAGWRDIGATEALIDYAHEHNAGKVIGHLCTTWGQVKNNELADFGPIRAAMMKLGGIPCGP